MLRAKIQDVARLADVSMSTVSAVLNEKAIVKESTKQRVLDAIDRLRYRPDYYASNLARHQTRLFGLIVSNLINPFFAETAQAIEMEARAHGYEIALTSTQFSPQRLRECVHQMLGSRVAGLAVMTSERDDEAFSAAEASGIPVVFLDVGKPGKRATNIRVDLRGGMFAAVNHLIHLGHRELLLIRNSQKDCGPPLLSHRLRDQGFAAAVRKCGIRGLKTLTVDVAGPGADAGQQAIATMAEKSAFTAAIAITDMVALGVYRGLQERGLRIPEDVSVIGFDNTYISRFLTPSLTTVDIPREELSRAVVAALLTTDKERKDGAQIKLATRLIVRESTATPQRRR
jgi:DNA-binding LacI/PurR family transcriptional regulator